MRTPAIRTLAVVAVALALGAPLHAQTADVAGTWVLEVATDQGITNPMIVITQDGADLTGSYSSETLGDHEFDGVVVGNDISFEFTADLQGQPIDVIYEGTLKDDGTLEGTIDIAGGMLTGTFTATRQ